MEKAKKTKFELEVIRIVAEMRHRKGLSQNDIATTLGVSRGFIGQVESPNSPSCYSINHINRLAFEFNCKIADLLPAKPIEEISWDNED